MKPAEFWALHPTEFWWIAEAKRAQTLYAGGMNEREVAELYDDMVERGLINGN